MRRIVPLTVLVFASGCSPWLPRYPASEPSNETGFYRNIKTPQLALLEYRLGKYFSQKDLPFSVVCAAHENDRGSDPSTQAKPLDTDVEMQLMRRFPALSPLARCERDGVDIMARDTKEPAAIFDVHDFTCEAESECIGWAGYYANGQHGWSYYRMRFAGGIWRIRPEELDIIVTADGK